MDKLYHYRREAALSLTSAVRRNHDNSWSKQETTSDLDMMQYILIYPL